MKKRSFITVKSDRAPIVEIDPAAQAFYVYFQPPKTRVAQTINRSHNGMIINVDLDAKGEVVGIEAIGAAELTLSKILQKAKVDAPKVDFSKARYRASSLVAS